MAFGARADFTDYAIRTDRREWARHGRCGARPSRAASRRPITQQGIVVWPERPQLHVSGAPVNLSHSYITDGYMVSPSGPVAYDGVEPLPTTVLSANVFTRTLTDTLNGEAYTVLPFTRGTQSSGMVRVEVVRTLPWNTAGLRDMRDRIATDGYTDTDCVIGKELVYPALSDAVGTLPGHADPEGRPGWLISGEAYDGVATRSRFGGCRKHGGRRGAAGARARAARRADHPGAGEAPTTAYIGQDAATGGHDLRVAWYLPGQPAHGLAGQDGGLPLQVADRRKHAEDRHRQRAGSEIGNQSVLLTTAYASRPSITRRTRASRAYSPNYEHALLAASNRGNSPPALLRAAHRPASDRDTQRAQGNRTRC